MNAQEAKLKRRVRRQLHVRRNLSGTSTRPRLAVFRSNKHIYCQVIDDDSGKTLASASTRDREVKGKVVYGGNIETAKEIGKRIAEKAKEAGVCEVVFDRRSYKYHGRVKALSESAREAGLKF